MKALDLVRNISFMMGAALVISLMTNISGIFPADVLTSDVRSKITIILLATMMCMTLSRIPFRDLNPVTNWKSVTKAALIGLVAASVIPLVAYLILGSIPGYGKYAKGLIFIAAAPFAASVGPLSLILRGDLEHALRSTIIVYAASLVWIPFIIWITLGQYVGMKDVVITIIEIIGVPLVASRLLTRIRIGRTVMSVVLNCTIAFLVWLSVSATSFPREMSVLFVFVVVAAVRDFGLGAATEVIEKKNRVAWSTRVTDILMISYKNKGIAIALCVSLLHGPEIGNAMVAIAASIVVEIVWVEFMDSVLFSKKRMEREIAGDCAEGIKQTWES